MFILSNFLVGLAKVLEIVFTLLWWLILIRAIISWFSPDPFNPLVQFLYQITEPILYPLRKLIPPTFGVDLSPLLAFLLIVFLKSFLINSLIGIALRIR
ncbi:MAG: YggT family protein [Candidatus Omnitrophica bacterium]|nr:YggT family protein [Candidatus Omnitrophota bacterium]